MAGMLIRELKARRSAERILILVPPLVLKQWQQEMQEKFAEPFTILTRSSVNESRGKNPFIENDRIITSLYWAARDDIKSLLMEADFDFVIVDEAHKMAAYTTPVLANTSKLNTARYYPEVTKLSQDLAGGFVATLLLKKS